MSNNILNDISKVYFEQVSESAVPGKPAEKLGAVTSISKSEQEAARQRTLAKSAAIRAKKGIKEATKAKPDYLDFDGDGNTKESMKKALRDKAKQKVQEAKKPNDGNLANNYPPYDKVTRGDIIAGALGKDQMGGKKKVTKEGYSNWRQDLSEVIDDTSNLNSSMNAKVKEKKVNNTIKINPSFNDGMKESIESLGGELLEMVEIEEEYITEEIEIATEYFYKEGLNEDGIDILIEKLGLEEFVNFVYDLSEEYILTEASETRLQKMAAKRGKIVVGPKGSKPQSTTKAAIKKMGGITKKIGSSEKPSSTISKQRKVAVKTAVAKQPDKKPIRDAIARGIFGAVKAYKAGMERHRAATSTASKLVSQTAQTAAKAAKVGAKGASEFGKGVASGVSGTATAAKKVKKAVVGEAKIEEKITKKTSKEKMIHDFVHSNDSRLSGSKSERIRRALGAWYSMHKEATAPTSQQTTQQTQQTTQQAQKPNPAEVAKQRQIVSIQKKQTTDRMAQLNKGVPLTSESSEDSARDGAMERGGLGANPRQNPRQSYKPNTTPSKKRTPEEIKANNDEVMNAVRNSITAQYGKGALM
jgi:hypothetical protein